VARVVVDVMLKPEILDPQGKAVATALPKLGVHGVTDVRQGKRFEIEVDELTDERLSEIHDVAEKLLANPVIEDFFVYVEEFEEEADDAEPAGDEVEEAEGRS